MDFGIKLIYWQENRDQVGHIRQTKKIKKQLKLKVVGFPLCIMNIVLKGERLIPL